MSFGQRLREARKRKNLSQEQIASIFGISTRSFSRWEMGINEPSIEKLKKLTEILDVSIEYLLEIKPTEKKQSIEETFIEDLKSLNQKGIDKVADYIQVLKEHPVYSNSIINYIGNKANNAMKELYSILDKLKEINPELYDWITIKVNNQDDQKEKEDLEDGNNSKKANG